MKFRRIGQVLLATLLVTMTAGALHGEPSSLGADWPLWNHYAEHFVSADGRVIDPDRHSMTTSEAQSYAMFFALVAGDRAGFERLRIWTEKNLARGSLGENLPSWSWGQADTGEWKVLDPNSASDADLWIAYDLLQAGELWNKQNYKQQGLTLLRTIAAIEVTDLPGLGPVLLPGSVGFRPDDDHWLLNPSYMPPALFNAAAHADAVGPWRQMARLLPVVLERTASNGFAMDWTSYTRGARFVPAAGPGDDAKSPQGSYDAIRVYLWLGIGSSANPASPGLLKAFSAMGTELRAHPVPPETVAPDGTISGAGPLGFSAALVPFLWASHQVFLAGEQQRRMESGFDPATGLLGSPARYYDQNLALFATGWLEKRFRFEQSGMLRVSWKK